MDYWLTFFSFWNHTGVSRWLEATTKSFEVHQVKFKFVPFNTQNQLKITWLKRLLSDMLLVHLVPHTHVSQVGVIPKHHQPNKCRLIVDLSHPASGSVNGGS